MKITKDARILDAGCGFGIFTKLMHEKFGVRDVRGFDFSLAATAQARMKNLGQPSSVISYSDY